SATPRPFLLAGFSPHNIVTGINVGSGADYGDLGTLMAHRARQGFNFAWVELLGDAYMFSVHDDGTTYNNIYPFQCLAGYSPPCKDHYDMSVPNEPYWARVDRVVAAAAANGIALFLTPVDWGTNGDAGADDWHRDVQADGSARMYRYGQ